MPFSRLLFCSALGFGFVLPIPSLANTFYFSGAFTTDDEIQQYTFTTSGTSTVTLESFGYGGNGSTVPAGGFAPVLSLFGPVTSGDPNLINSDEGGTPPSGCGARMVDSTTGLCLDAFLSETLGAGTYLVTLTENDNTPNGPDLLSGFNEMGNGNFTGPDFGTSSGETSFVDPFGNQRTPNYDFSISGVVNASSSSVPEPSTMFLLIAGSALLAVPGFVRKIRS